MVKVSNRNAADVISYTPYLITFTRVKWYRVLLESSKFGLFSSTLKLIVVLSCIQHPVTQRAATRLDFINHNFLAEWRIKTFMKGEGVLQRDKKPKMQKSYLLRGVNMVKVSNRNAADVISYTPYLITFTRVKWYRVLLEEFKVWSIFFNLETYRCAALHTTFRYCVRQRDLILSTIIF